MPENSLAPLSPYQAARRLASLGYPVFPLHHPTAEGCSCEEGPDCNQIGKHPRTKHGFKQGTTSTSTVDMWNSRYPDCNWGIWTEQICVIDIDPKGGGPATWAKLVGTHGEPPAGPVVTTGYAPSGERGRHLYFRGQATSRNNNWPSVDRKSRGGYVVAPGSRHHTGVAYDGVLPVPGDLPAAPEWLLADQTGDGQTKGQGGQVRSMLTSLLGSPPAEGGRNDWLTKVAGHYAKQYRGQEDAYRYHLEQAAGLLPDPLGAAEVEKIAVSIWRSEQNNHAEREVDDGCGWLRSGGDHLKVTCMTSGEMSMERWSDFDLAAVGVYQVEDATVYDLSVRHSKRGTFETQITSRELSDSRKLDGWLAARRLNLHPKDNEYPRKWSPKQRLSAYLDSQDPAGFQVVDSLGWFEPAGGFVTTDGVITESGLAPHRQVKPTRRLRNLDTAPYRYGVVDPELAKRTLAQVLGFHDETVCGVYGAWWAAVLLKPQIMARVSQFPFMAVHAPSALGKTRGFFALMHQLSGSTQGPSLPTPAALRDYLEVNHSGVVWVDDANDADTYFELVRAVTSEATLTKKGEDRTSQVVVKLVGALHLSGESMPIQGQKALLDRAVLLDRIPDPKGRLNGSGRPQWEDILDLQARYPQGLSVMSGTLVQLALAQRHLVATLGSLVPSRSGGRWADKMAVLRLGARVLDGMLGTDRWAGVVDRWVEGQIPTDADNALTLTVIPSALSRFGMPTQPGPASENVIRITTPAYVEDSVVFFNVRLLEEFCQAARLTDSRLFTAAALSQQTEGVAVPLDQCGKGTRKYPNGRDRSPIRYRPLSPEYSRKVLEAVTGESPRGVRTGGVRGPRLTQQMLLWAQNSDGKEPS